VTGFDETVLRIEQDDAVLQLTLQRPDSANALDSNLTEALLGAITQPRDVRLCIVRGAGRHFCSGFDLADLDSSSDADLLWRLLRIETLLQAVYHAPFATVALAQGQVIGAGADLFAACWRRVAAPDARFRMPGWNFELALGTRRLVHLIGQDAARDLLIDTKVLSADESRRCGLATDIASQVEWPVLVAESRKRATALPPRALARMLDLTAADSRDEDIAAIVQTAGRPGLKQRIIAYRNRVTASTSKQGE
jgi:enoyl-CoA hydratase/carnithine racemase